MLFLPVNLHHIDHVDGHHLFLLLLFDLFKPILLFLFFLLELLFLKESISRLIKTPFTLLRVSLDLLSSDSRYFGLMGGILEKSRSYAGCLLNDKVTRVL